MAELVDALGSGPSSRKGVWVRVPFWAKMEMTFLVVSIFVFDRRDSKRGARQMHCLATKAGAVGRESRSGQIPEGASPMI